MYVTAVDNPPATVRYFFSDDVRYRQRRWGAWGHLLPCFGLVDTTEIRQLHWNINVWTDQEVMAWKESYMSACSAIQVSVRKDSYPPNPITELSQESGRDLCQCWPHGPPVAEYGLHSLVCKGSLSLFHDSRSDVRSLCLISAATYWDA